MDESPDYLLLSGTVVGENPDHVCWAIGVRPSACDYTKIDWTITRRYPVYGHKKNHNYTCILVQGNRCKIIIRLVEVAGGLKSTSSFFIANYSHNNTNVLSSLIPATDK